MFKLLVLSAVLAVATAKPGYLQAALPVASSYSNRVDYNTPLVQTQYLQPVVQPAPVVQAAPVISHAVSAQSQSRVDVSAPRVVSAGVPYATGSYATGPYATGPYATGPYATGVYGHPGQVLAARNY